MSDSREVEEALNRFRRQHDPRSVFGLEPIQRALAEFDNPQDEIPPAIHVTGTNGKGSACAFIRAMAEAAGLKVHVFTSPHLIRVNERIRVASELVSDEMLVDALKVVHRNAPDLSYFEALTASAFLIFAREPADISIIEVGAGGATDATNVMAKPAATVVTPISRDHEAMFNVSGVAAIARLKAGIFRPHVPAIIAEQPAIVAGVLREEARKIDAPLVVSGKDWRAKWEGQAFRYESETLKLRAPWLGLRGAHQAENAGAACAAIEALGDKRINADAMSIGLREVSWPARLQRLGDGPLTKGYEGEIWIDAAHNPGGAAVLAQSIKAGQAGGGKAALVMACQAVKDVEALLAELLPAVDMLIACPLPDSGGQEGGAGAEPDHIAQIARTMDAEARIAPNWREALKLAKAADRIFVTGSLYLCGAVMAANGEQVS